WRGGLMVLLILFAYALVRTVIDYWRDRRSDDVVLVCTVMTAIGAIMVAPVVATSWTPDLLVLALLASGLGPIVLFYFSSMARRRMWSCRSFLLFLLGCVIAAGVLVIFMWPAAFNYAKNAAAFMLRGSAQNITEMHPLFTPFGTFSVSVAWTNFVGILPASLVALFVLWRSRRSPRGNEVTLFVVWSLVMLAAVITQRRFGYYYSVNAAVLTGFITAWVWNSPWCTTQRSILQRQLPSIKKATAKSEKRAMLAQRTQKRGATVKLALLIVLFFALTIVPCVRMARNFAIEPSLMTTGWYETMLWLQDNTPEPMSDNADMLLFDPPSAGSDFDYPPDAYSIMAWWDYGHWLTSVAKRIPVSNPFQDGARVAAGYLSAQNEADGAEALEALGSRYVMVDAKTSVASFPGVVWWASLQEEDFFELYYQRTTDGTWESILLYYPRYYESMLVRLYNFSAERFSPEEYTVIRYDENRETTPPRKEIVAVEWFSTYDEALLYLQDADDGHFRLVSSDPLVSAIPLDALQGYVSVYESPSRVPVGGHAMPEVKVFEYTG
ncbi:MAG: hypothetical protein KAQ74_01475, partial [Dehalococcoidia bacterium]|nr:hypothetical protein [Dehalococcoidia bacterium]